MAQNAEWILDRGGENNKVVLFAHNVHVAKESTGWFETMGSILTSSRGDQYVAIGQFFEKGHFRAWDLRAKDR